MGIPFPNFVKIYPGAYHSPGYLTIEEQRWLVAQCQEIGRRQAGFYMPTVRGGAKMRIEMLCLGRHWNALTYKYEAVRSDYDGLPVQRLPESFASLAVRVAADVGMKLQPQVCILNSYKENGRLGLHQDKDERPEILAAGIPIVSVSVGSTARFLLGGIQRKDPKKVIFLQSGDVMVLGGASRMRYHGVVSILPATAPTALGIQGRLNLTFRQETFERLSAKKPSTLHRVDEDDQRLAYNCLRC